ncbi:FAD-binding oxidoreductase [Lentibacillus sp. CBA3610]|uniref:NAD(P)/FAD-dependent oxidoreductase n=1 Tax=Lentibacillus sp. CBA3610 TaxID=2518176 RepID=UPI001594EE5C|nr:FAD-dependent oxidoreductase [Lentibacillus sp. CBA3610]QKY68786.1 FAD-binding oxidoreductase [Lentibacillus sp. CBA3610]
METADAVVIGGGVIGTSIAYRLSEYRKVFLIEQGEIGAQTSGSCDKAIFLQSKKPGFPIKLAKASREIYENLEGELDTSVEFKKNGGMIVIESEAYMDSMKKFVKEREKAGIDVKLLDHKEVRAWQPGLSSDIAGASWCAEDAEVNPLLLTQAFAQAARRRGADIRTHTEVTDILCERGKVVGVQTTHGRIATETVINAAGPFAFRIAEMAGVGLTIMPRRGAVLITEKLDPLIHGNILCSQYIAAKHAAGDTGNVPPYGIGLSLGQTDSGNLLIGGSREFKGFDKSVGPDVLSGIAKHAVRIAPVLKDVNIIRSMAGFRPFTGDGLPVVDKAKEVEGFIIAAGHEGDGIALAPITGQLVASLVENKDDYNDLLKPLRLDRPQAV